MALHLIKLCVGAESIEDLEGWIAARLAEQRASGAEPEQRHTTRMVPKRFAELIDGGSLFWVIKGYVSARQRLLDVRPFKGDDGIGRCHLVLDPAVVPVSSRPYRPFQGWRYMKVEDAPADLGSAAMEVAAMPEPMRRELRELGLL